MDRKQEILEAATKSFTLFGYKATTMDQVSKIANVGKGTIYTFFANKEILFQEIVVSMIRQMKQEVENVLDPKESLMTNSHVALMKILQFREEHLLYAKLIQEEKELGTPTVEQILRIVESEIITYIAMKIQIGIDKNEIRPCEPQLVAFLLFKSYLAFVVDWQETHEQPLPEEKILSLFKETIFRGLMI